MARVNAPLLAFNRGLISPKALARVDLDRARLSAEVFTNWIPKTQGAMIIRPGTKYLGSSCDDTGAYFVEFVASTTDTALLELSNSKMRVWDGDELVSRPLVGTTVTLSDTGWENTSTGGTVETPPSDLMPTMDSGTWLGVTITASSEWDKFDNQGWRIADGDLTKSWIDTGTGAGAAGNLPSWVNVDFDTGDPKAVGSYAIQLGSLTNLLNNAPRSWRVLAGNYDTGTYATDTGKWTLEDERSDEIDWAVNEKRTYSSPGNDTGTVEARRHWRFYITETDTGNDAASPGTGSVAIPEMELYSATAPSQYSLEGGSLTLNASTEGAVAKASRRVIVDTGDAGIEHSLAVNIGRGPVQIRVGSSVGGDDYITETSLGTGRHNLAFTPTGNFFITTQNSDQVARTIESLSIGDSGTLELVSPWTAGDLSNIRYDQSADVIYLDCPAVAPQKIERRGTGRSWSVVNYEPTDGPFRAGRSSSAKLRVNKTYGNCQLKSDVPFFQSGHTNALFRLTHGGQSGTWFLGAEDASTDTIVMTGINDTGAGAFQDTGVAAAQERQIRFVLSGTYTGRVTIQRSFDGEFSGFHDTEHNDTGTATIWVQDNDDNVEAYYRAIIKEGDYTSGAAQVDAYYFNGETTGIARVTGYNTNQNVDIEVIRRFSDTGPTDIWNEGSWSAFRGQPTALRLHEGRLFHAQGASIFGSVSDAFESFDDTTIGEAAPINRTLGSGPVDNVYFLDSQIRLIAGTAGSEIAVRSSSLDEPLNSTNATAKPFGTQGSANLRAVRIDNQIIFVQRSGQRVFTIGFGSGIESGGDYESSDQTLLVPDLLVSGVVDVSIQRQPDTRVHFVLGDGRVAILTYEPQEDVLAWSMWETDTGTEGAVERVAILPGENEDEVFYHVRRVINGATKRYLEKWMMENQTLGDTGLTYLVDCAASYTDTGTNTVATGFSHLEGATVVAWGSDTGTGGGRDLSPDDTGGTQITYTVDTGTITPTGYSFHHLVGGTRYTANFKSSKMPYGAQAGTALAQLKKIDHLAMLLYKTHNNGILFGDDTGHLDPLPRILDNGAEVDADLIFDTFDEVGFPAPNSWDTDARVYIRAASPRPATVLALVPTVDTNEKV